MTDRELMQQALEALEWVNTSPWLEDCYHAFDKEVVALRERLAQPEQKPIATVESVATVVSESGNQEVTMSWWHEPALPVGTKLYTTPPQRKPIPAHEIVTLYDERPMCDGDMITFARAIEAAHGVVG